LNLPRREEDRYTQPAAVSSLKGEAREGSETCTPEGGIMDTLKI